eukprot:CAMPEP_0197421652 /NCGR_PEP_ID=MMETSP1170-20131217/10006_1 /TAXON_ID=54406 /ORGANISM="Sarcinochrysis sp, Strain CCMP770" /LENGTH=161 /DNA_ID=CAMNT_0042948917 /DNA_START=16 /DNA_END=501 /DNA_ORIENTATION=-
MAVVFLDIDGVLAPFDDDDARAEGYPPFEPAAMEALAAILRGSAARLVLSSSWRSSDAAIAVIIERFRAFGPPLACRALATTDRRRHEPRQWEIARWLAATPGVERWVAIDDEDLVDGGENRRYRAAFRDHVVKVDSAVGLTAADVPRALEALAAVGNLLH